MHRKKIITIIIYTLSALSLNAQNNLFKELTNSKLYSTDTVLNNVEINGENFRIQVMRDKYDEHLLPYTNDYGGNLTIQSAITILITRESNNQLLYYKRFDYPPDDYPYINYVFFKGQFQQLNEAGKLYLLFNKHHGGSGSQTERYLVNYMDNRINLYSLFASGELTSVLYAKSDNEILVLEGIWGEDESHFGEHQLRIKKFDFSEGIFKEIRIGTTKNKYPGIDDETSPKEVLQLITKSEPELFKEIDLNEYLIK